MNYDTVNLATMTLLIKLECGRQLIMKSKIMILEEYPL